MCEKWKNLGRLRDLVFPTRKTERLILSGYVGYKFGDSGEKQHCFGKSTCRELKLAIGLWYLFGIFCTAVYFFGVLIFKRPVDTFCDILCGKEIASNFPSKFISCGIHRLLVLTLVLMQSGITRLSLFHGLNYTPEALDLFFFRCNGLFCSRTQKCSQAH